MIRYVLLAFFLLILLIPGQVSASHVAGGEITWRCQPGGQFKFQMRFYRDCNGIPGPASVTLTTTVPGIPTIAMSLVSQTDISQTGFQQDGVSPCLNCLQGGIPANPGLIEEFVFESAPLTLPGTPPPSGWTFLWGECCRNNLVDNISGAGAIGMGFRAIMFPFQGMPASPCSDNSPYFAEKPMIMNCTGHPFKYNNLAVDAEQDSLVYEWTNPVNDIGATFPWAPGYSTGSQLPSAIQNPANVGATIHPATGEIAFTSFTGGLFATAIKVTAWKCGYKVAEIFRDVNVQLNNNCPPVMGGILNTAPAVNAPFYNPVTGLQTEYIDTVYAGDTVHFDLTFTDFDLFTNGALQQITVDATGELFGAGFTDPNQGCPYPPCATMSASLPYVTAGGGTLSFNWVTDCVHVWGDSSGCTESRYNFTIKIADNYCPSNGRNISTVSILVLPKPGITEGASIRCVSVNPDTSVSLSWLPPAGGNPNNSFHSYVISASTAYNGTYQAVATLNSGFGTTSYTHTKASQLLLFGATAAQQPVFYRINTVSACGMFGYASNVRQSIHCDAQMNPLQQATITWNTPAVTMPATYLPKYRVYREYPSNTWTLVDSTVNTTFTDPFTQGLCNEVVGYRVEMTDSSGCIVVSSADTVLANGPATLSAISPANPGFCPGQSVTLTAAFGQSYLWSTGATTQSITVNTAGTYSVTVTAPGGCTGQGSVLVNTLTAPTATISGNSQICSGSSATIFIFFTGTAPFTYSYYDGSTTFGPYTTAANSASIPISPAVSTTFVLVSVTDANCTGTVSGTAAITVIPLPTPVVTAAGPTSFCAGDSVLLTTTGGFVSYIWYRNFGPVNPQPVGSGYYAKTRGNYYCVVTDMNGCSGASNGIQVYVPCVPIGPAQQKDEEPGDQEKQTGILVYPNPSHHAFTIELTGAWPSAAAKATLTDASGRSLLGSLAFDETGMLTVTGLAPGLYVLRVQSGTIDEFRKLVRIE